MEGRSHRAFRIITMATLVNIEDHETWKVQDATKLQAYMNCPRRYFFEYVLGWRSEIPNNHLEFGSAWHMAMEVFYEKGVSLESAAEGYKKFEEYYREQFDETWDEGNAPKNPGNALRARAQYVQNYKDTDDFEVLHIEVAGSVAIAPNKPIYFKTDTICRDDSGVFSLEHKTGSYFNTKWAAQWRQKMQVSVYSHVLFCLFEPEEVYGVKINGVFFANPPRYKANGEPYANARDNEFHRVPVRKNLAAMQAWLVEVTRWYDMIQDDFNRLASAKEEDEVLEAFPRNTESCTQYGPCPFLDYCSIWNNPIQYADSPPIGYRVEHWDPRKIPGVRETVEL